MDEDLTCANCFKSLGAEKKSIDSKDTKTNQRLLMKVFEMTKLDLGSGYLCRVCHDIILKIEEFQEQFVNLREKGRGIFKSKIKGDPMPKENKLEAEVAENKIKEENVFDLDEHLKQEKEKFKLIKSDNKVELVDELIDLDDQINEELSLISGDIEEKSEGIILEKKFHGLPDKIPCISCGKICKGIAGLQMQKYLITWMEDSGFVCLQAACISSDSFL